MALNQLSNGEYPCPTSAQGCFKRPKVASFVSLLSLVVP